MNGFNADWLVPAWPAPQRVNAVFTTRQGGVSSPPWGSMNLGSHVGDLPAHVQANRLQLQTAMDCRTVFLNQVHGTQTCTLDSTTPHGQQADACLTTTPGLACCIMVADCLPVLLAARDGSVVGAAHAGWRGLAGEGGLGVLESLHAQLSATHAASKSPKPPETDRYIAWLGPCIGAEVFEVGAEVRAAFVAVQAQAAALFRPVKGAVDKFWADLPGLARLRLKALGVTAIYGNDGSPAWCTVSQSSRFFSHRRDAGVHGNGWHTTGRMVACVWLS